MMHKVQVRTKIVLTYMIVHNILIRISEIYIHYMLYIIGDFSLNMILHKRVGNFEVAVVKVNIIIS